jgi:hypothetical protein
MSTRVLTAFAITLFALAFIVAAIGVVADDRRTTQNNAFAKECNTHGGVASFTFEARQCIGARPAATPAPGETKS